MDSASIQSAAAIDIPALPPGVSIDEFFLAARAESAGLDKDELAALLVAVGTRYNFGLASGMNATSNQMAVFWRSLQLPDLALARACALGRDAAWQEFIDRFRAPLTQAAVAITGSAAAGQELAGSLYAEMFGLRERDGQRQSPLAGFSGRGSLMGFLRATLAQRNVDRHRRMSREASLPAEDFPVTAPAPTPRADLLEGVKSVLGETLGGLEAEERFLLSAWFLDERTLLDISRILQVHEATVSRRIQRVTARLRKELARKLQVSGMSHAAAEEALSIDPRDLEINLRSLLQTSRAEAFPEQVAAARPDKR